ncbi:MAG: D-amino acid aminotransferase [Burkholderiales bacterium]
MYLNGEFVPPEQARVSVLDRGFLFGDGVYEVIPVYSRYPFRLRDHLMRLQRSLESIRLANPYREPEWERLIGQLVDKNPWEDQYVYLQVTRGVAKRDHAFPAATPPTVFMMSSELVTPPQSVRDAGIAALTVADNRWLRCDIKAIALLANVLLRQAAVEAGTTEAVLLRDGFLTEGAASNIFVVRDGIVLAPPKNHLMLPGITYDVVLELAQAHTVPHQVRDITEAEVRSAQELWMTSSTKEILPITTLDGKPVGSGKPGPVYARMYALYQAYKETVMRAAPATVPG